MGYTAVRTDQWKYVRYKEQPGADELYDLKSDPYELRNLATDPASAPMLAEMKQRLERATAAATP
jgi:N-acetylglucosamine-6-sulfatase